MGHQKKKLKSRKQLALLILFIGLAVAGALYANQLYETRSLISVHFLSPQGQKSPEFKLDVMATESERNKGLMYVREMDRDRGMLFIFPREENHTFWMKNTYIPLDMIFITEKGEVAGTLENVPILNIESRNIGKPSKFVVELNAGSIKPFGLGAGWKAVFSKPLPVAVN